MRITALSITAMLLLVGSFAFTIPHASALTTTTVRIMPVSDSVGVIDWDVGGVDACAVDADHWDELDEFPEDGAVSCRGDTASAGDASDLAVVLQAPTIPSGTILDIDVTAFIAGRRTAGVGSVFNIAILSASTPLSCLVPIADITSVVYVTQSQFAEDCTFGGDPREWTIADINGMTTQASCEGVVGECAVTNFYAEVTFVAETGGGGPPPDPTPIEIVPPDFELTFDTPCSADSAAITLVDSRPLVPNTVYWIWTWGDGTETRTTESQASHTYKARDIYNVTVRTQGRGGQIDVVVGTLDLTDARCLILPFARIFGPYLMALLIIVGLALLVNVLKSKQTDRTRRLTLIFLIIDVILGVTIAVFIFYGWRPMLPGGIQF